MLNINIVEEINEGTLFLRKISKNDATYLYDSLKEKSVNLYLSLGPLRSMDHSKRLIKGYLKDWDSYAQYTYIIEIRENDNIEWIGCVSLWGVSWMHGRAEVGIWLNSNHFNKGNGTTALKLIKNVGFLHLNLHRLEAHTAIENETAIKLFEKSGFVKEGKLKEYIRLQGVFHDTFIYSILKNQ